MKMNKILVSLKFWHPRRVKTRAAAITKFPPIPIPDYSTIPMPILPIPQIADTFADTDTFGYFFLIYD